LGKLSGRVAIVTGGSRGNGRGIALALARDGANVVIADVLETEARKVAEEIEELGREALVVKTDVTNWDQVQEMVKKTLNKFGKIDILVNNVGINIMPLLFIDFSEKEWDAIFDINVKSMFFCTKAVLPHMIKQKSGKIINISSMVGKKAMETEVPYCASKAAVIGLTQGLALELGKHNINVNAICPGVVFTEATKKIAIGMAKAEGRTITTDEEAKEYLETLAKKGAPLGRLQTTEDIGNMAAFLASDDAKNITGQAFNVCGGMQMSF